MRYYGIKYNITSDVSGRYCINSRWLFENEEAAKKHANNFIKNYQEPDEMIGYEVQLFTVAVSKTR